MKSKKHIRSLTAITFIIGAFVFILWAVSMFCMTVSVAQQDYQLMLNQSNGFTDNISLAGRLNMLYDSEELYAYKKRTPGFTDYCMLDAIQSAGRQSFVTQTPKESISILRREDIPLQTAVIFYDRDGNVLHESSDYLYFKYVTDDIWRTEQEEQVTSGNAWIDLGAGGEDDPYARFRSMYSGTRSIDDVRVLRITGYMKGSEIIPVKLDYVTETLIRQTLGKKEPDVHKVQDDGTEYISHNYTVSELDHDGLFEWQSQFDNSANAGNTKDLVTIYGLYPNINIYNAGEPVMFQNEEYDNLFTLLKEKLEHGTMANGSTPLNNDSFYGFNQYSLDETIVFGMRAFRDLTNYDSQSGEPVTPPDFIMVTAISSHPLRAAVSQLRTVYIVTFLMTVLGLLILRKVIKRNLTQPVEVVNSGIAEGWSIIYSPDDVPKKWREPFELYKHYDNTKDTLRRNKNEIIRLNTALDYAKKAELTRRQMTSNIAHEFKTPLAVIHSYSEGLKEHIAEEKREQYLDVILSESERMDAMVLEMLDLSRLEAGKVKLARDEFSMNALVNSIFNKLAALIKEKELKIAFDLLEDSSVIADEARMEQVVMNFAANAVQYTPEGGNVLVKTYLISDGIGFSIENDSSPFTTDELSKVWETFYRADKSRSGKGTGLGLAIAKSIIDLHGGKCSVSNTLTGVKFSFSLSK